MSRDSPTMAQRITLALPTLTPSQRQMADYITAHPLQVATMPIDGFALATGVSVATANRFARALQFDGYAQFRSALIRDFASTLAPVEKLRQHREQATATVDVFSASLEDSRRNIQQTRQSLDAQSCEQAVTAA